MALLAAVSRRPPRSPPRNRVGIAINGDGHYHESVDLLRRSGRLNMIPPLNDAGYLPEGVHTATLEDIAERFGQASELRQVQMESIVWLVDLARRAGVERLIINGSFVSDKLEPNDVDCLLLLGTNYPVDAAGDKELQAGLPFIEMKLVRRDQFDLFVDRIYATDRDYNPKGMLEVPL
jgi:hypothetical protein